MRAEESGSEIQRLIEIAWRRKWVILIPFLIIFTAVTLWGLIKPNLYRSTASIFIEPQEVPSEYVRSTVTSDLDARLRTVTQQLTSRTKLLLVIDKFDLYPIMMEKEVPPEVLVARMREDLSIETPTAQGSSDYFQVSYIHREPTKAMLAVSNLISLFIAESVQIREQQAKGTTLFIEEELEKLKMVLEEQERAIQKYKRLFMGELPDQLDANLRMLDNLQLQLSDNIESKRETNDRVMILEREISRLEGEIKVASSIVTDDDVVSTTDTTLNQLIQQRDSLRQRVATLQSIYTEKYPDLIAAKKDLARIEERLRKVTESLASGGGKEPQMTISPVPAYSMEITNLRRQLNDIRPRLSALQQEVEDLRKRFALYQKRVEAAPEREQRLLQLRRDYENTKKSYEDLLNKKLEAQLSENLEKRQKGENFRILDPANFPEKPFLPNRLKIISLGFAGGLGSGIALAFLLEMLFPAFFSLKELKSSVDLSIVLSIPYMSSPQERKRWGKLALVGVGIAMILLIAVLALLDHYVMDLKTLTRTIGANMRGIM
jgi:polysaccharide chain length determinant protein (PEP-CTERM system associated)